MYSEDEKNENMNTLLSFIERLSNDDYEGKEEFINFYVKTRNFFVDFTLLKQEGEIIKLSRDLETIAKYLDAQLKQSKFDCKMFLVLLQKMKKVIDIIHENDINNMFAEMSL